MVDKKYFAIYTDDLGCEKAEIYFIEDKLYLKVRDTKFCAEDFGFDFYSDDVKEAKKKFLLKDNELIDYVLDIQIPISIEELDKKVTKRFIFRLERQKNYYDNYLLYEGEEIHNSKVYNFKELLINIKDYIFELKKSYVFSV